MATSKAIRADDVSGLNIATVSNSEDAVTKDFQRVVLNDPTTVGNMAGVDGSGNLKVTGTVTANAGSGTQAVRPSDGTNAVTKTFDLDSGAGTEWNLGVGLRKAASGGSVEAGSASDPLRVDPTGTTVQPVSGTVTANIGTSGSLALDASVTGLQVAQASTTSGQKGNLVQGAVTTNAPTYTTAQTDPLSLDTSGNLRVSLKDTPQNTNALKVDGSAVAQPVTDNSGSLTVDNGGTFAVQAAQSGTWTVQPGNTANTTAWKVDGSAVTQPVSGTVTATLSGSIANTGFNVTPATSGGLSAYHVVSAGSNNAASIKGSAGQVYGWNIYNNAAYPVYVKLYNKATAPAPATDNALLLSVIGIQAGVGRDYSSDIGVPYGSGIGIAVVKDISDTGNTSVVASDCTVDIFYK